MDEIWTYKSIVHEFELQFLQEVGFSSRDPFGVKFPDFVFWFPNAFDFGALECV